MMMASSLTSRFLRYREDEGNRHPAVSAINSASYGLARVRIRRQLHTEVKRGQRHLTQALQETEPPESTSGKEEELLRRDVERYLELAQIRRSPGEEAAAAGGGAREVLDKVLIADFFFVCAALAWLLVGVVQQTTSGSSGLLGCLVPIDGLWFSSRQSVF
eukprot:jgi/Botrbrau1/4265/Bobra.0390s0005.1